MADLWSKSEWESGVNFDIQLDSNSKFLQQPKDDALTNCDTEKVTKNLVTTVLQKSKSYLDAAKEIFVDNDDSKTFPTGSTLDQTFEENEGERTAESHTSKMEVEQTAESPDNHQTFTTRSTLNQRFAENEG